MIAAVSLAPSGLFSGAPSFAHADKVVHFLMYGTHAALLLWALDLRRRNAVISVIGAVLFCAAYGVLMEVLQSVLLPNDRCFSTGDIAANIAGASCFSAVLLVFRRRFSPCI